MKTALTKTLLAFIAIVSVALDLGAQYQPIPAGEIILTNEYDLIGAGYDYQLRGPSSDPIHDTGSFSLTGNEDDRKFRFDHCFLISPGSSPWFPSESDRRGFFRFVLEAADGTIISESLRDFNGDPEFTFRTMVHYANGHSGIYNIPAPKSQMADGDYKLTVSVNPYVVVCAPAVFHLGVQGEDSWMSRPPEHPIGLLPFVPGSVTGRDLNPAAPRPPPEVKASAKKKKL
jgi:hypothetical protein